MCVLFASRVITRSRKERRREFHYVCVLFASHVITRSRKERRREFHYVCAYLEGADVASSIISACTWRKRQYNIL